MTKPTQIHFFILTLQVFCATVLHNKSISN